MKKIYAFVLLLFIISASTAKAQLTTTQTDSLARIGNGLQLSMKSLPKRDMTVLTGTEQTTINAYLNTLGTQIRSFTIINGQLFVDPQKDACVFDLLEGIKEQGIQLMYVNGHQMSFVNDDLKLETWSIK
jgi:hypothetical protein